jgi:hypothetical protein
MTHLLKKAFEEAAKLAPEAQDALARALLHDIESEHRSTSAFTGFEADSLGRLADEAIAEYRRGGTKRFPSRYATRHVTGQVY